MPNTSRKLKGYRLGFFQNYLCKRHCRDGATILDISAGPQHSEEAFRLWWEQQNRKAARDGEVVVVVKMFTGTFQFHEDCLKDIEEREFYATSQRGDRVRTIKYCKLLKALRTPGSVVLADDWGDAIEKLPHSSMGHEGEEDVEASAANKDGVRSAVNEDGLDGRDIDVIMSQASCSRFKAIMALLENDGDLINAIMSLTT